MTSQLKRLFPNSFKQAVKSVLQTSFIRSLRFDFLYYIRRKTPILVYQMGKVGSKSVVKSLELHGELVYHTHSLNAAQLRKRLKTLEPQYARGLHHWIWMHDHILAKRQAKVKYITLVRDPNAVFVAGFFENLDRWMGQPHAYQHYTLDELMDKFNALPEVSMNYEMTWFDKTMKVVPGIDVFAHPFDKEKGYSVIKQGNDELLILKLELDDTVKEACIADFLGLKGFKLVSTNVGDEKAYADVYQAFKRRVKLPPETVKERLNSRLVQHFYTPDEIEAMRQRWIDS